MSDAAIASSRSRGRLAWRRVGARARTIFRGVISEPLVHFAIGGLLLFVAGHYYQQQTSTYKIVVTKAHIAQLERDYALQFGGPPNPPTLESLIHRDLHDEILYRQGLALHLDSDDQIVRRRVVQKMQFLMQDLHAPAEPTPVQLATYYRAHGAHYMIPARVTFSHIFFSVDRGGDAGAKARAKAVLGKLTGTTTRAPDMGDPFPDLYDFSAYEPEQVERLFGHTAFSKAAFSAPVGHWAGPFKSGYGWHLIYIDARTTAIQPSLTAVHDAVRTDYLQDAQDKTNKAAFDKLEKRFTIIRKDQEAAP